MDKAREDEIRTLMNRESFGHWFGNCVRYLFEQLDQARETRDACQRENSRLVEENRSLSTAVDRLTETLATTVIARDAANNENARLVEENRALRRELANVTPAQFRDPTVEALKSENRRLQSLVDGYTSMHAAIREFVRK